MCCIAWIGQFSFEAVALETWGQFLHFVEVGMPNRDLARQVFEDALAVVSTGK